MTPARTMTIIGESFFVRRSPKQRPKMPTKSQWMPVRVIGASAPQKALMRIEIPAAPIIAVTAGHNVAIMIFRESVLRYLKYTHVRILMMIKLGVTKPKVATTEPIRPATFVPTKVAELMAIGPGVICEMVMRWVNSSMLSQWWMLTT